MITWPDSFPPRSTAYACATAVRLEIVIDERALITEAALAAAFVAQHMNVPVVFEFNGHWCTAYPTQAPEEIVQIYWAKVSNAPLPDFGDQRGVQHQPKGE